MRVLDHVVQQHFGFFHAYRRGHLTDKGMVARFLEESCELAGLEAVREDGVPNPVVSTAHKFGLGGLMHITTSAIDWMGWHKPGDCEYFTVLWYTCGARMR